MEMKEKAKIEEEAKKKQSYKDFLRKQMEEAERKKKSVNLMTEQEKRLNMKEIEGFANKDLTVHAKIVGMRSSPIGQHQKYIAMQYGLTPSVGVINSLRGKESIQMSSNDDIRKTMAL